MTNPKLILRSDVKARLGQLTPEARAAASAAIVAQLASLPIVQAAHSVLLYCPMPFEPDVAPLAMALLARNVRVAAPLVDWPNWSMQAALVTRWPEDLTLDPKGLHMPRPDAPIVDPESLDAVIVPGVAFDRAGRRLGRGGGFYDRYLTRAPLDRRIGVCFACQLVESVPTEPHDAIVATVITD